MTAGGVGRLAALLLAVIAVAAVAAAAQGRCCGHVAAVDSEALQPSEYMLARARDAPLIAFPTPRQLQLPPWMRRRGHLPGLLHKQKGLRRRRFSDVRRHP